MPNAQEIMQKTEMGADLPCRLGLADGAVTGHSDGCWIEPDCLPFLALIGLSQDDFPARADWLYDDCSGC
jgi:hypothetical protein